MNAKELMIGDLVRMKLKRGTDWSVSRVGCVNKNGLLDYEPIPLTEDIVSHNIPFERCWDVSKELPLGTVTEYRKETETAFIEVYYYHDRESKFVVEIKSRSNNDRIYLHVNYVHELQRALRCFGLFDLANNFKI